MNVDKFSIVHGVVEGSALLCAQASAALSLNRIAMLRMARVTDPGRPPFILLHSGLVKRGVQSATLYNYSQHFRKRGKYSLFRLGRSIKW